MVHLQWGGQGREVLPDRHRNYQDLSDTPGSHRSKTVMFTAAGASSANGVSLTAQRLKVLDQQLCQM